MVNQYEFFINYYHIVVTIIMFSFYYYYCHYYYYHHYYQSSIELDRNFYICVETLSSINVPVQLRF